MIITELEHRGRRWQVIVHPVPDLTADCGLELIFAPEGAPEGKYAWPIQQATLDRLTGPHLELNEDELRKLLDQAIERRRPPVSASSRFLKD